MTRNTKVSVFKNEPKPHRESPPPSPGGAKEIPKGVFRLILTFKYTPSTLPTRVYHLLRPAYIALHLTTPVEHAIAPFHNNNLLAPETSATAHEVATLDPL